MDSDMSSFNWYARAKERVEQFLPSLDKDLEVEVDSDVITPTDGSPEYTTFLLTFSHARNTNLQWTMELRMDDEYLEHELEETVRRIYFQRVE